MNGKTGWFPESYAEVISGDAAVAPAAAVVVANGGPNRETEPGSASFDWSDDSEGMSFAKGDKLEVMDKSLETWFFGKVDGKGDWGYVKNATLR